ncbi:ATP-binding cassette domain-containing protein [Candidatus Woesearchaeota archaeon]|nr:ATP-binding cassette domain-containing protein [Candidatus Woesearchaeota archaeon]
MQVFIQFKNLIKGYGKTTVIDNLDLDIGKGELFGVIGMSGSGKTTLLKTMIGFLEPESGEINYYSLKDKKYKSIFEEEDESRRMFGFSTQMPSFYPKLTTEENMDHFASLYDMKKKQRQSTIKELLSLTGLTPYNKLLAEELSGGMEKRLSIACSLVHKPSVLILDEPTADLDPVLRKETWNLIKRINNQGTTIIVASHLLDELEENCDRVGILHKKKISAVGTPAQLKKAYSKRSLSDVFEIIYNN